MKPMNEAGHFTLQGKLSQAAQNVPRALMSDILLHTSTKVYHKKGKTTNLEKLVQVQVLVPYCWSAVYWGSALLHELVQLCYKVILLLSRLII